MANEKRLIEVAPLIDECKECMNIEWNKSVYTTWAEAEEDFMQRLLDAPTVDAAPVVHGYWIHMCEGGYSKAICSACGVTAIKASSVFISDLKVGWRYCPSCGAKMDGDGNG